ncbi:RNA polymerase sigma-70 factor (ECF subfamily) [Pseudomonas hunanensis]|uniref:RNA polymerase sigma-70 factor (ECF subfamily) n=1 Tax=Pseudomonas hunanensis TaxID=1247546 RepID=A0ACC6K5D1_9PSED|nr:sigma-70 family RNA polymerase sigma factor [Pseudomonas hunanensis]MDR6713683.1 RNA polymerase sigma-70 factor (ECF subfamily) [Pseudomonas hunanensis]
MSQPTSRFIDRVYDEHHAWLRQWLCRRLGCHADAADLAHDAFLRLLLKPVQPVFDNALAARGYLRKIANGLCINLWQRREIEQAWLDTLAAQPEQFAPSAEHSAAVLQALQEVGGMLLGLPDKAAQAFVLAMLCQMTDKEVAAELGVSDRMVRKYVARAMLGCLQLQAAGQAGQLYAGQAD